MRAAGALPTELRVQKMNEAQWLWYYMNLQKDLEEDRDKAENYLDYLGSWVNPELAQSVMAEKKRHKAEGTQDNNVPKAGTIVQVNEDTEIEYGDTAINDGFEAEYQRALAEEGISNEEFTELPDSQNVGNPYESQEDFLARVMNLQGLANEQIIYHDDDGSDMVASIDPLNPKTTIQSEFASLDSIIPNISNTDELDYFDEE